MPAHIRTALTAVNLNLPVRGGRLASHLAGIYVWEHRVRGHARRVTLTSSANNWSAEHCTAGLERQLVEAMLRAPFASARPSAKKLAKCAVEWQVADSLCKLSNCRATMFCRPWFRFGFRRHGETSRTVRFHRPEIFPIDDQISLLHAADWTVTLERPHRRQQSALKNQLLYNQTGKTNRAAAARPPRKLEINELPPDARFRIDPFPPTSAWARWW